MAFRGRKYLVTGHFYRGGMLFLRCAAEPDGRVSIIPASITDYPVEINQAYLDLGAKTHFTIQGLNDAASILENALKTST